MQHVLAKSTQDRHQEGVMRLLREDERFQGKEGELALSHLSVGTVHLNKDEQEQRQLPILNPDCQGPARWRLCR